MNYKKGISKRRGRGGGSKDEYSSTPTHTQTYIHSHTFIHAYTYTLSLTHTYTHRHTSIHIHTPTHVPFNCSFHAYERVNICIVSLTILTWNEPHETAHRERHRAQ